ncbi:MAG: DPP IV N-terminal domain-containing protein, partial [Armatimonadaceae bacterium]
MKTLAAITALGIAAVPSLSLAQDVSIKGAQAPALSPDGKKIAFSWRGDVYIAPATGGTASPLTAHAEFDGNPVFSPDGKWIAFSSNRNGNSDIYIVPSAGGTPRRITKSPASEVPTDWTPDGKSIYFSGNRESSVPGLYTINIETLRVQRIVEDFKRLGGAASLPGGKQVIYTRDGFPWTRPRYRGS